MKVPAAVSHPIVAVAAALITWVFVQNPTCGDRAKDLVIHKGEDRGSSEVGEKPSSRSGVRGASNPSGTSVAAGFTILPNGSLVVPPTQKGLVQITLNEELDHEQLGLFGCAPEEIGALQTLVDEVREKTVNGQVAARRILRQEGNETVVAIPPIASEDEVKSLKDSYRERAESILGPAKAEWLGEPLQLLLSDTSYRFGGESVVMSEKRSDDGRYSYEIYTFNASKSLPKSGEPLPDFSQFSDSTYTMSGLEKRPGRLQQLFQGL